MTNTTTSTTESIGSKESVHSLGLSRAVELAEELGLFPLQTLLIVDLRGKMSIKTTNDDHKRSRMGR